MTSVDNLPRWQREIMKQLLKKGLDVQSLRQEKHVVVAGSINGNPFRWVTSKTPSGVGASRKALNDLRKELRRCGMEEPPRFAVRFLTANLEEDPIEEVWSLIHSWEDELTAK